MNRKTLYQTLGVTASTMLLLGHIAAKAEVWGIKSLANNNAPSSSFPADLFHFAEDGSEFQTVAPITVGGSQIDADGLAINNQGTLFAFEISNGTSRLLTLDPSTAIGTPVGPFLNNLAIRGAIIAMSGQLLVVDATSNQLLEVSVTTGEVIGSQVTLMTNGVPYTLSDNGVCDIAQSPDGTFFMTDLNNIFKLDVTSGALTLLYTDNAPNESIGPNAICGFTFSKNSADPNRMFAYNVNGPDDIYTYDYDKGFARALLYPNIIPSFNSGRGDLAAQICPQLKINLSGPQQVTLSWTTNAASYVLQCTACTSPAVWNTVSNSTGIVDAQFSVAVTTTNSPQFFRLQPQ